MENKNNGFDEMQTERRNRVGNQTFMIMFYALLIDSGLYGFGIRWLNYPGNVMVIIIACMSIYLVRLIAYNAYLPPKAQNRKTVLSLLLAIIFSIGVALTGMNYIKGSSTQIVESTNDYSALILMIVSAVGLFISMLVAVIKKVNDKDDTEE
jgi:peptidoglycan biosynthesis protein MviN/MurJ (putative lipid II flippase)